MIPLSRSPYPPMRRVVRSALITVGEGTTVYAHHVLECGHTAIKRILTRPMNACPCKSCLEGK